MNHIKHTHEENKSWCGETLNANEFHFKTVEQAVINGLHLKDTVACPECVSQVIGVLYISAGHFVVDKPYRNK